MKENKRINSGTRVALVDVMAENYGATKHPEGTIVDYDKAKNTYVVRMDYPCLYTWEDDYYNNGQNYLYADREHFKFIYANASDGYCADCKYEFTPEHTYPCDACMSYARYNGAKKLLFEPVLPQIVEAAKESDAGEHLLNGTRVLTLEGAFVENATGTIYGYEDGAYIVRLDEQDRHAWDKDGEENRFIYAIDTKLKVLKDEDQEEPTKIEFKSGDRVQVTKDSYIQEPDIGTIVGHDGAGYKIKFDHKHEYCWDDTVSGEKCYAYILERDVLPLSTKWHDAHYDGAIQPIEAMQSEMSKDEFEGFLRGNIVKYALRFGKKDETLKEAQKILRYAQWLVEAEKGNVIDPRKD